MNRRNNKGFTLMEMLIVVAIIAILVAIAIPALANQLEKSREAVDLANVRSAYAEVLVAVIEEDTSSSLYDSASGNYIATVPLKQKAAGWTTHKNDYQTALVIGECKYSDDTTISRMMNLPLPEGSCTVTYITSSDLVLIDWGGDAIAAPLTVAKDQLNAFWYAVTGDHSKFGSNYYTSISGSWDSTYNNDKMRNVWKYLKDNADDIGFDAENIKTWAIINPSTEKVSTSALKEDSLYYVWSTKDVSTYKAGDYIPVVMSKKDSNGNTTHTVGNVKVTNGDAKNYNVISNGGNTVRPNKDGYDINKLVNEEGKRTFDNYEDAARYYESLASKA